MGIRGLTTFIQNRSNLYMEKYELHDTSLILDGNAVACQLYRWHTISNDCFGGDYDKYANVIRNFFHLLFDCNVTPYVVFDGGYEKRKVATVINRMKNKIKSADQLNCVTECSISVFPLLLRLTFLETITKLNIKILRCDFEGDSEIASIARTLNCPVLSFDSDFYILDVLYIPFNTLDMSVKTSRTKINSEEYLYIPCEVYKVENFVKRFNGLNKTILPILAVLLGNDYVKRSIFSSFYQNLKMQKCACPKEEQKRIKSLIMWLQNETIESAIEKVLSRYKKDKRKFILSKIQNAIQAYNNLNSKYLSYFGLEQPVISDGHATVSDLSVAEDESSVCEEESEDVSASEGHSSSCDEIFLDDEEPAVDVPSIFFEKFRTCQYPASFMNILFQHKYYCEPQVEMSALPNSHEVNFDILSAIHKILTDSNDPLICIGRTEKERVGRKGVAPCDIDLPTLLEIQNLNTDQRKQIFFKILKLNDSIDTFLQSFPSSWHLLLLAIKYLMVRSTISWPLVYSILLCSVILKHVDKHIGFHRSVKAFNKRFGTGSSSNQSSKESSNSEVSIAEALGEISYQDCKSCMRTLISFFELDDRTTIRSFDRSLVHSISQFQSCLMHIGQLNSLLNSPFLDFVVSECLNCTFLYYSTKNFSKRSDLDDYMKVLLKNSPTILHSYGLIIKKVKEAACDNILSIESRQKRRRRKKKKDVSTREVEELSSGLLTDEDSLFDPNNKFAVLSLSKN
nr:protein asteroid [Leptinotarsa decemlineata]